MHEFREIAQDVYAFLQPPLICYSNVGVIVGERDVIVVDSLTNAAMTESLLTEIRRVTSKPIRFLINTHSHVDHVYTNHLFPDATVIASNLGREETKANLQAQAKHDAVFGRKCFRMWISEVGVTPCRLWASVVACFFIRESVKSECWNSAPDIPNPMWWCTCRQRRSFFAGTSS